MQEQIDEFIDYMVSHGIAPHNPKDIVADDTIHRYKLYDDKSHVKTGSYRVTVDDDGFGYGWCQSFREGVTHSWHTKAGRKLTPEQRAEHKRKTAAAKRKRDLDRELEHKKSRAEAVAMWKSASKSGCSPYADRKGVTLRGVRYDGDTVLVPMWRGGEMVSVQRILPDGTKLFIRNSDHVGAYFSIKGDIDTIAICEGLATGFSVHEATGWSVICAFNAGNLKPVAKSIRDKYPNARIVFASDNDHTVTKGDGTLWNPGREKSEQAAVDIGGAQVFMPNPYEGVTDWNDIHTMYGINAVRDGLINTDISATEDTWEPDNEPDVVINDDPLELIKPLGYNNGIHYFLPMTTGQITPFSATALGRKENLFQLADRAFWERIYAPEDNMTKISEYACGDLIKACQEKGFFRPDNVRGVGVWEESGKILVNCGDLIVGDGIKCYPSEYRAKNFYEAGPRVIDLGYAPMTNKEGAEFRDICKRLSWKKPQYADIMAGWCVISMIGGVLRWRPHIFLTGPKGTGKSTVMDYIIKRAVGGIAVCRDGGTTEPGVRKALGCSSRPFIMDEAESESRQDIAQMQKIFFLFRRASSGAIVENAYSTFVVRSCACFAAINPRLDHGADKERSTVLELCADTDVGHEDRWNALKIDIRRIMTDEFAHKLMSRTVANLDVLMHNIDVFVAEASTILGSMRAGDQVGPMIAGAHSLISNKKITPEFARDWMINQDWGWHSESQEISDSEKMIGKLMTSRIRYDDGGMARESQVAEMVQTAYNPSNPGYNASRKGLGSYGMKIVKDRLVISNSCNPIKGILRETPWTDYRRTLANYPNSDNFDNKTVRFAPGIASKATSIPLSDIIDIPNVLAGDDGFEMEGFQ